MSGAWEIRILGKLCHKQTYQAGLFYSQILICQKKKKILADKQSEIVDMALVWESCGLSSFLDVDNITGLGEHILITPTPW